MHRKQSQGRSGAGNRVFRGRPQVTKNVTQVTNFGVASLALASALP